MTFVILESSDGFHQTVVALRTRTDGTLGEVHALASARQSGGVLRPYRNVGQGAGRSAPEQSCSSSVWAQQTA